MKNLPALYANLLTAALVIANQVEYAHGGDVGNLFWMLMELTK